MNLNYILIGIALYIGVGRLMQFVLSYFIMGPYIDKRGHGSKAVSTIVDNAVNDLCDDEFLRYLPRNMIIYIGWPIYQYKYMQYLIAEEAKFSNDNH